MDERQDKSDNTAEVVYPNLTAVDTLLASFFLLPSKPNDQINYISAWWTRDILAVLRGVEIEQSKLEGLN